MTLATVIAKKVYTGNASTTEFPFAYKFYATSNLVVNLYTISDGTLTLQVEDTDYTVVGGDDGDGGTTDYTSGGTVVMTAAPSALYKLIIERILPFTQTFDFAPSGPFSEDSFEEELDRIVSILQQQQAVIDICIKMDKSNTSVSDVFDVEDLSVSVDDFIVDELTAKTTIGTSDYVAIADGDASNINKKILASSIVNINGLTEDTNLHANDVFIFEDSQASYVKKKVKRNNLVNINSLTEKSTLANADLVMIEDSAASNVKKKVQALNILPINTMTEKTTLAVNDLFVIEDSAASNVKKKVKYSNVDSSRPQIFTSSGTFTVPAGVTKVYISMVAGGGGGGGNSDGGYAGGGGAGECIINYPFTVTPAAALTVTIGAGGAGGAASDAEGVVGGDSVFSSITMSGGNFGRKGSIHTGGAAYSNNGGAPTAGARRVNSGSGGTATGVAAGGGGGGSPFGAGGAGGNNSGGTAAAVNTGGGGGGGAGTGNQLGAAGGSGICVVIY